MPNKDCKVLPFWSLKGTTAFWSLNGSSKSYTFLFVKNNFKNLTFRIKH